MADRRFAESAAQDRTAEFIGNVTRSLLAALPQAQVTWSRAEDGDVIVIARVEHKGNVRSISRALGPVLTLRASIRDSAKNLAANLCRELVGG